MMMLFSNYQSAETVYEQMGEVLDLEVKTLSIIVS